MTQNVSEPRVDHSGVTVSLYPHLALISLHHLPSSGGDVMTNLVDGAESVNECSVLKN